MEILNKIDTIKQNVMKNTETSGVGWCSVVDDNAIGELSQTFGHLMAVHRPIEGDVIHVFAPLVLFQCGPINRVTHQTP